MNLDYTPPLLSPSDCGCVDRYSKLTTGMTDRNHSVTPNRSHPHSSSPSIGGKLRASIYNVKGKMKRI